MRLMLKPREPWICLPKSKHVKQKELLNQQEFQKQRMDSQNQLQKEIMELAAQHGALTPEVVQEMLRQQTAQKAIDGKEEDSE